MEDNNSFRYTYSAEQQEELRQIRARYQPKEETTLEQIRRLDRSVTKRGTCWAIILGTISALILGAGMSMAMVGQWYVLGIAVGCVGILGVALAYPLYLRMVKKDRARVAPEILRLTAELLGE